MCICEIKIAGVNLMQKKYIGLFLVLTSIINNGNFKKKVSQRTENYYLFFYIFVSYY